MKTKGQTPILLLALLCAPLAAACGDDDHDEEDTVGLQQCCWIGEICHEGSEANMEVADCHDLGHEMNPTECRANFDRCKTLCDPQSESTLPDHCEDPSGDPH